MFNGTQGRLELNVIERSYVSGAASDHNRDGQRCLDVDPSRAEGEEPPPVILLQKHWEKARRIELDEEMQGGHGGGDERMLHDLLRGAGEDPLGRAAGYVDGARSILVGIAANRCFGTGQPVDVRDLV